MFFSCQGRRNEQNSGGGGVRLGRSLLNYVPFIPTCLTCISVLRAYVPHITMCLLTTCLRPYAPSFSTCVRASYYYVPTCLILLCACVSNCPHFSRGYVPKCPHFSRAYVPTCFCAYIYFSCLRAFVS